METSSIGAPWLIAKRAAFSLSSGLKLTFSLSKKPILFATKTLRISFAEI